MKSFRSFTLLLILYTTTSLFSYELPFVIVTCSYNNAAYVQKNLDSLFSQKYTNFRLIYIDDGSCDGTAELVEVYKQTYHLDNFTLIKNTHHCLKGENIYKAGYMCSDEEIIVILDGDDWFAHEYSLAYINNAYQKTNAWLSYGKVQFYPQGNVSNAKDLPLDIIEQQSFRKYTWVYSHPRSFYAWLFKLIKLEDQLTKKVVGFEGKFFPNYNDRAILYPMLEMAKDHIVFIKEVGVIQNCENPISSHNPKEGFTPIKKQCSKETVGQPIMYAPIENPILNRLYTYKNAHADCIIIIEDITKASSTLCNVLDFVQNLDAIIIVSDVAANLEMALKNIPSFYKIISIRPQEFNLHEICSNKHLLLMNDSVLLTHIIDCSAIIYELERTFAYAWYNDLSLESCAAKKIPAQHIENGLYVWRFLYTTKNNIHINSFNGMLCRTKHLRKAFSHAPNTIQELQTIWKSKKSSLNKIGLFHEH
ncbi:MAG: glycosyltransferase family 2 protein [Candidatus Babeliales bacterium]